MTRLVFRLFLAALLLSIGARLSAQNQEAFKTTATLSTTSSGQAAIIFACSATQDGEFYDDYDGVEATCQLTAPNGSNLFDDGGGFQRGTSYVGYPPAIPITQPGSYSVESQYTVLMYLDEDCYCSYDDPGGLTQIGTFSVNLNTLAYDSGNGDYANDDSDTFQYGESNGTLTVGAPTVLITPETDALDRGQQQTFTASVSGVGSGGSTGVTWTISPPSVGTGSASGTSYSYTAPANIASNQDLTLKACSIYLPGVCATTNIALLVETIVLDPPSPSILFADGVSESFLNAYTTNAAPNTTLTWTPANPPVASTGPATATYTAPLAPSTQSAPTANVSITACDNTGNPTPAICGANHLTLVQLVSITGGPPSSLNAGTTTNVTINGGGFGTSPSVTVNSPSWPNITFTQNANTTNNQITGSLFLPANLSNVGAWQPISLTVSATTDGLSSSATSNTISIVPIIYTYAIVLTNNPGSLTYGQTSNIVPIVTCKVGTVTCGSGVSNPQTASFSIVNGAGSLSNTGNASATTFTATGMSSEQQTITLEGCASISPSSCATTTLSVAATTLTLSPSTVPNPLTHGMTQNFSPSIQNPGIASQVTWTLTPSPSNAAPGTLASATTNITGTPSSGITPPDTFTAPNPIAVLTTVTLKACMSVNLTICATPVAIALDPPPTFAVAATSPSQATPLSLGHSMTYTVSVSPLYGFTGTVALSVSGLPQGVTAQLSTSTIATSGSATLTLAASYNNPKTRIGSFPITVTGTGSGLSNSTTFTLTTQVLQYKGACNVI